MTFTTLQYAGVERPLADWGVSQARRELSNQARDHFACDMILPADTAPDPIPYGGQIILRIGRAAASGTGTTAAGLPLKGLTAFTGGTQWFVGWRVETFRSASPDAERLEYKFAGPWEFLFERLVFRKLQWNYNGVGNVADWRSQVVLGESVTGKELIAGALHSLSQRRQNNYIRINCAAIPETLLESELFGHERGSFTGAIKQKLGRVEEAHGGTIFMDEIGDMSRPLQAKLLRFLEYGSFTRVGGNEELHVDVRLIPATNRRASSPGSRP